MSEQGKFFTVVGCIDGRVQKPLMEFGQKKFEAEFPDTITGPGIVKTIAHNPTPEFLEDLKSKIDISVEKHGSRGIIVDGHEECAGNVVSEEDHIRDIQDSVEVIRDMVPGSVYVVGVWVKRSSESDEWLVEEVQDASSRSVNIDS